MADFCDATASPVAELSHRTLYRGWTQARGFSPYAERG